MTNEELSAAQQRLTDMNSRDKEIRQALELADVVIAQKRAEIVNLTAERKRLKAEYGPLFEEVGAELKYRESQIP